MEEEINVKSPENPDSINIGSASKGGALKVYFNSNNVEEAKKKMDNAKEVKDYTNTIMERPIAV